MLTRADETYQIHHWMTSCLHN